MALAIARDPNAVPSSVIRPYIQRWYDKYSAEHPEQRRGQKGGDGYIRYQSGDQGRLDVLAHHAKISARVLKRHMLGELDMMTFNLADRIICATDGPLAWHTEEDLIPYYGPLEVSVSELKEGYELPEGFDFKALKRPHQLLWENAANQKDETCTHPGCEEYVGSKRRLCETHRQPEFRKERDRLYHQRRPAPKCTFPGCENEKARVQGSRYCPQHREMREAA